jgi:hypothetical protein
MILRRIIVTIPIRWSIIYQQGRVREEFATTKSERPFAAQDANRGQGMTVAPVICVKKSFATFLLSQNAPMKTRLDSTFQMACVLTESVNTRLKIFFVDMVAIRQPPNVMNPIVLTGLAATMGGFGQMTTSAKAEWCINVASWYAALISRRAQKPFTAVVPMHSARELRNTVTG